MLKKLLNYLENKKILILGFGKEGYASYKFLRKNFPEKQIFIADKNTNLSNNVELLEDIYVELSLGENYLNGIEEYDLILKTPGISFKDIDISKFEDKITSQLQLFLEYVDMYSIGITGTKGKSTTSTLIYKVLMDQNKDAFLIGNIGEPIFNQIEEFSQDSIAVIEISSHALEYIKKSTNIAILLDIFEEHLDHYKNLEKYIEAKFNLAKYQEKSDLLLYNYDNELMNKFNYNYKENDYAVSMKSIPNNKNSIFLKDGFIYCNNHKIMNIQEEMNLKGTHNINNIMFVLGVCNILNLDFEIAIKTIKKFIPLEHRMEFFAKLDGVEYYNDSIATIPEATINAIKALQNVTTLIVGGKDRGVDLSELITFLSKSEIQNIICLPKTGEFIKEGLEFSNKNVYFEENLRDAVKIAKNVTQKGICLLSPAASSYGYFKNFEERGRLFKEYVISN